MTTTPITSPTHPQNTLGILQLTAGATMISFSAVFVKLAHVEPTMAGFYRMLFGGLILLAIVWFRGERLYYGLQNLLMVLLCSLFFALDLTFWHRSIHYVGPGLSTLLANFQVFFLAAFGIITLGEKPRLNLLISIPLAMVGLYLIVGLNWGDLETNSPLLFSLYLDTQEDPIHFCKQENLLYHRPHISPHSLYHGSRGFGAKGTFSRTGPSNLVGPPRIWFYRSSFGVGSNRKGAIENRGFQSRPHPASSTNARLCVGYLIL
jgi:uncharacterized membrane protein